MLKHLYVAAIACALAAAPAMPSWAQTSTEKSQKADQKSSKGTTKKLTPQQAKMKDCATKWGDYKKEKNVKGRAEYRKFMSGCLKA